MLVRLKENIDLFWSWMTTALGNYILFFISRPIRSEAEYYFDLFVKILGAISVLISIGYTTWKWAVEMGKKTNEDLYDKKILESRRNEERN